MQAHVQDGLTYPKSGSLLPDAGAEEPATYQAPSLPNILRAPKYKGTDSVSTSVRVIGPSSTVGGNEVEIRLPPTGFIDLQSTFLTFTIEVPTQYEGQCLVSPPAYSGLAAHIGRARLYIADQLVSDQTNFAHYFNLNTHRLRNEAKETLAEMSLGCAKVNTTYQPILRRRWNTELQQPDIIVPESSTPFHCQTMKEVAFCKGGMFCKPVTGRPPRATGNMSTIDYANILAKPLGGDITRTRRVECSILFSALFPNSMNLTKAYPASVSGEMRIRLKFDFEENKTSREAMMMTPSLYATERNAFTVQPVEPTRQANWVCLKNHERSSTIAITNKLGIAPKLNCMWYGDMTTSRHEIEPRVVNPRLHVTFIHMPAAAERVLDDAMKEGMVYRLPVNTQAILRANMTEKGSSFSQFINAEGEKIETFIMLRFMNMQAISKWWRAAIDEDYSNIGQATRYGPLEIARAVQTVNFKINQLTQFDDGNITYPLDLFLHTKRALGGDCTIQDCMFNTDDVEGFPKLFQSEQIDVFVPETHPMMQPVMIHFPLPMNISRAPIQVYGTSPITKAQRFNATKGANDKLNLFVQDSALIVIHTVTPFHLSASRVQVGL